MPRFTQPPVALTFLAPADRCNQRCPACILDRVGEPTTSFALSPDDYSLVLRQLDDAGIPILSVGFQGYEVTLARSWPYVEAAFASANELRVRTSFITNGMLLHKWTDRVRDLDVDRITVSLDGADPETNDPIRGLPGAFLATTRSVKRFVAAAPEFRDRMKCASTLFDDENVRSLQRLPKVLRDLGINRWGLSVELDLVDGEERPVQSVDVLSGWMARLVGAAEKEGIELKVDDEFRFFAERPARRTEVRELYGSDFLVRIDPGGFVRVGREIVQAFDPNTARRFDPRVDHIADVIGYTDLLEAFRSQVARSTGRRAAPGSIHRLPEG